MHAWFIVHITQVMTVYRDLIFAGLNFRYFIEIKDYIYLFILLNFWKLLPNYVYKIKYRYDFKLMFNGKTVCFL